MVEVRAGTPADVPFVFAGVRALAEFEGLTHLLEGSEEKLHEHLFGARPSCEILVGSLDGEPAGYALFFTSYSTFLTKPGLFLEDLFVVPERRGTGVGRALLTGLAELAVERGCGRLEWSVLDWNEKAIGFYESLGAEPVRGWIPYRLAGEALAGFRRG